MTLVVVLCIILGDSATKRRMGKPLDVSRLYGINTAKGSLEVKSI